MKRLLIFGLLLALNACGYSNYQPQLASVPTDKAKYESDRKECVANAHERQVQAAKDYQSNGAWFMPAAFGIAGATAQSTVSNGEKDYNKTPMQMIDECMFSKGYKVIKTQHCC